MAGRVENLKPFTSEYQPKNKGVKKSRLRAFIKENDLGRVDIQIIAKQLLDVPMETVKAIASDPKKPILLAGAAMALLKDMKTGRTDTIRWLADRGFGQATQVVENRNHEIKPEDMDPETRDKYWKELMREYVDITKDDPDQV